MNKKIILISSLSLLAICLLGLLFWIFGSSDELEKISGVYVLLDPSEPQVFVFNPDNSMEVYDYHREWRLIIDGTWGIKDKEICMMFVDERNREDQICLEYKIVGDKLYTYEGHDEDILKKVQ